MYTKNCLLSIDVVEKLEEFIGFNKKTSHAKIYTGRKYVRLA